MYTFTKSVGAIQLLAWAYGRFVGVSHNLKNLHAKSQLSSFYSFRDLIPENKSPCQPPVLKVCQDIAQRIKKDNKNEIENVLINGSDVISTNSTKHMQLILT